MNNKKWCRRFCYIDCGHDYKVRVQQTQLLLRYLCIYRRILRRIAMTLAENRKLSQPTHTKKADRNLTQCFLNRNISDFSRSFISFGFLLGFCLPRSLLFSWVKVKKNPTTHPWRRSGREVELLLINDLGTRWDEWSASRPGRFLPPGKDPPVSHCTRGWVCPRAGLNIEVRGKSSLPPMESNLDRPVVQSVVRHYTDWATPACILLSNQH
jgi:hypothetical protein